MTFPHESPSPLPGLDNAQRVRIANLGLRDLASSTGYIEAQVVLVWPYSSSTRQFAFLLSEPDAHPLKSGRQVKIALYNGAARAVQTSKVGIGDRVRLVLRDCQWQDSQDPTATPGKRVKWDLIYRKAIALEVKQTASEHAHVVKYESTGTPSPRTSPLTNGALQRDSDRRDHSPDLKASFRSSTSRRTSGIHNHNATPNDPFLEDIEQDAGKSRKRTKFARPSGSWRLLDDDTDRSPAVPSSPLEHQGAAEDDSPKVMDEDVLPAADQPASIDETNISIEASPGIEGALALPGQYQPAQKTSGAAHDHHLASSMPVAVVPAPAMGPPTTPARPRPDMRLQLSSREDVEPEDEATTPRLHPLSSHGLPLISPLLKTIGVETGYFPETNEQSSELDAISHPATESRTAGSVKSDRSQNDTEPDDHLTSEEQAETSEHRPTFSDEPPCLEERSQAAIMIEDDDEDEEPIESVEPKDFVASTLAASRSDKTDATAVTRSEAVNASKVADDRSSQPGSEEPFSKSPLISPYLPGPPVTSEAANLETQMRHEEEMQSGETGLQRTPADIPSVGLLDGTFESPDDSIPEHVRLLQGNFESRVPKLLDVPASRVTPSAAAEAQNKTSAQTFTDKASQPPADPVEAAPRDFPSEETHTARLDPRSPASQKQLMTPAQTQDLPQTTVFPEPVPAVIIEQEPLTPQATQTEGQMAPFEQSSKAEEPVMLDTKHEGKVLTQPGPSTSRRVSQRLSRKSEGAASIESPFFTSREAIDEGETPGVIAVDKSSPQSDKRRTRQSKTPEPKQKRTDDPASAKGKATGTSKGTNTTLAYYPSLSQLHEYYGQVVDIIAVCAEPTPDAVQAKSGPRDWHTTLRLVDPDTADAKTTVQVFRPYKQALPSAQLGDIAILRNFKVQTAKRKLTLLSTDSSAWAIFKSNSKSRTMFDDVKMTGPQLEYGRGETAHVKELVQWYTSTNRVTIASGEDPTSSSRHPIVNTNIDQSSEETSVLESVEQATSPRRSRRLRSEAGKSPEPESLSRDTKGNAGAVTTTVPPQHEAKQRTRTKTPTSPQVRPPAPSSSIGPAASDTSSIPPLSPRHTRRRTRSTLSPAVSFSAVGSASAASSIAATSPTEATFGAQSRNKGKGKAKPTPKARDNAPQQQAAEETQSKGQQEQPRRNTRARSARAASPPVVHELRDGMRYTDDKDPEAPPKRATRSQVHELRDGNRYVDETD